MNRKEAWERIRLAGELGCKGNEDAASILLMQAARFLDPKREGGMLITFAEAVSNLACSNCGVYVRDEHIEGCIACEANEPGLADESPWFEPVPVAHRQEVNQLVRQFGPPGSAG
jgi:hypothetical protein